MDGRGPETPGGGHNGRGVDAAVWIAVIAVMIAVAGGVAWLSKARIELPEIRFSDDAVDVELIEPVPPPVILPRVDALPTLPSEPKPVIGPNGEIVRVPVWVSPPAPAYPGRAMRQGVESGVVTLRCEALASGDLGACEVLAESPAGVGFAEAALKGARGARVKPRSIDGFETDSTLQFTVRFMMASEP